MADPQTVLQLYGITDQYPTSWPADKDESDASDGEPKDAANTKPKSRPKIDKAKSRYTILERPGKRPSLVPGAERTRDGIENIVAKDEPDPLGKHRSVVQELQRNGMRVDDDKDRNQFLLSSTTFNPTLYLSKVHQQTSSEDLQNGLDYLQKSIDKKSASLKILVESNFERFVRAKSTIDSVYTEMRNQGLEVDTSPSRPHSRHNSRTSNHFRTTSNQGLKPSANEKRKLALVKESEYGTQGVKAPLVEVSVKAEEVWGPALGGRDRENLLRSVLDTVDKAKEIMSLPSEMQSSLKQKDYTKLVEQYTEYRRYVDDSRTLAESAARSRGALTDAHVQRIIITAKASEEIEEQISAFKRSVWKDLSSAEANLSMSTDRSHQDDHIALISVLLSLGVDDNPIWIWLLSRWDYLRGKISQTFERSRVEIEVYRRRLANAEKPGLYAAAIHYRSPARTNPEERVKNLDTAPILELWDMIVHAMGNLLSLQGGVLGEVVDYWEKAQAFIDGKAQRTLPVGVDGKSKIHHTLSADGVKDLQSGVVELIDSLRESIHALFTEAPIEDVSLLFSPNPATFSGGDTPKTPNSASLLSPFSRPDQRFNVDLLTPPPPSPRRDEFWESFAFWPPYANSLSGVHFLGKIVLLVGTAAIEMSSIKPVSKQPQLTEKLKSMFNAVRQRSAEAVCASWQYDANTCKVLEDWTRGPETPDVTRWPSYFSSLEGFILSGTQKILYAPAITKGRSGEIIAPPPGNLLGKIKKQFVKSISDASFSMASNASDPVNVVINTWSTDKSDMPLASRTKNVSLESNGSVRDSVDASSKNLRVLLTLSNISALRTQVVPALVSQFESDFTVTLAEEAGSIADLFSRIESQLFQSYTRPKADSIEKLIKEGVSSSTWVPNTDRPTEVRGYVYAALLQLVYVHSEVSSAAPPLVPRILSHLLEASSKSLLEAFRARGKYTLPALMQATLDVEFFAQSLSQYATERASETQSQIYLELDQGTIDGMARERLQDELPNMRSVLKKLREGTRGEFACFRKVKPGKEGAAR